MGENWNYKHVSEVFTEMANLMPALDNISWERVEREDHVTYPSRCARQAGPRRGVRQGLPASERHGQAGRGEAPAAERDARSRVSVHPHHRPPARALAHRLDDAPRHRARRAGAGGDCAQLSRGTIAKLGIKPGDMVRVTTRRGAVELDSRQDDAIPDGVVFIPFAYVEAAANILTNPALDPFGKIPNSSSAQRKSRPRPQMEAAE